MSSYSCFGDNFNAVDLIKLIEQTPLLWYNHHASYNNKQVRQKSWEGICARIVKNWDQMSEKDRCGSMAEIKNKWKNIKDTYTKDQKLRNKAKPKKRKYIYADLLHFLNYGIPESFCDMDDWKKSQEDEDQKPGITKEETNDSVEESESEPVQSNSISDESNSSDCDSSSKTPFSSKSILFVDDTMSTEEGSKTKSRSSVFVNCSSSGTKNSLEDAKNDDDDLCEDADKMFLLSLVPLFKNLNEHDKIVARIQLTQVLQRLLYPKKN